MSVDWSLLTKSIPSCLMSPWEVSSFCSSTFLSSTTLCNPHASCLLSSIILGASHSYSAWLHNHLPILGMSPNSILDLNNWFSWYLTLPHAMPHFLAPCCTSSRCAAPPHVMLHLFMLCHTSLHRATLPHTALWMKGWELQWLTNQNLVQPGCMGEAVYLIYSMGWFDLMVDHSLTRCVWCIWHGMWNMIWTNYSQWYIVECLWKAYMSDAYGKAYTLQTAYRKAYMLHWTVYWYLYAIAYILLLKCSKCGHLLMLGLL
jgi:hypothetical protein